MYMCRFCQAAGNEYFTQVPKEFIEEEFHWLNISYDPRALNLVLDWGLPSTTDNDNVKNKTSVYAAARLLYGLIHARFIITEKGLEVS